ncbi:MAG: hypothetical protein JEZ00_01760 [Anaerolineaceae bacterium]|nr:hypothetical protein [Anaerolineaceae bacterium]
MNTADLLRYGAYAFVAIMLFIFVYRSGKDIGRFIAMIVDFVKNIQNNSPEE